jgi:septal ring-binding cell division protein DamX
MKEVDKMRRAMNVLGVKAQLLIAIILVSATGAMSAETAGQASTAATEIAVPKADAAKKADAKKPNVETAGQTTPPTIVAETELPAPKADFRKPDAKKPQPHTVSWHCGWFPWTCSSGRVGLVLGTAY